MMKFRVSADPGANFTCFVQWHTFPLTGWVAVYRQPWTCACGPLKTSDSWSPCGLEADVGQGSSELAGERVQRWQADPAGAFRGQSVCVVGRRTESEGLKIQNIV